MAQQPIIMNADQLQNLINAVAPGGGDGGGRRKLTIFSSGTPTEWRTWRRNFQTIATINQWDDERCRREAAAAMEGNAALAIQDIDHEATADIETLLNEYQARFIPEAAGKLARAEFNAANQKPTETIIQWHTRLRELFCRAYPNREIDDDEAAIDQFVNHLLDTSIQSFVLDQGPITYADALNMAQSKLANQLILKKSGENRGNINQMGEGQINQISRFGTRTTGPKSGSVKCWYCQQEGHIQTDCELFQKGLTYFTKYFKDKNEKQAGNGNSRNKRGRSGGKNKGGGQRSGSQTVNAITETTETNLIDIDSGN